MEDSKGDHKPFGLCLDVGNITTGLWETLGEAARGFSWQEQCRYRQGLDTTGLLAAPAALPQPCLYDKCLSFPSKRYGRIAADTTSQRNRFSFCQECYRLMIHISKAALEGKCASRQIFTHTEMPQFFQTF